MHLHDTAAAGGLVQPVDVLCYDPEVHAVLSSLLLSCSQGVVPSVWLTAGHHLTPPVIELWRATQDRDTSAAVPQCGLHSSCSHSPQTWLRQQGGGNNTDTRLCDEGMDRPIGALQALDGPWLMLSAAPHPPWVAHEGLGGGQHRRIKFAPKTSLPPEGRDAAFGTHASSSQHHHPL